MAVDSKYYIHDADRKALSALKAIPGFNQLVRAFMKIWNERQFRILNMSSRIRINDRQLSRYYDLLPPICEKLGVEVPELYLELDVRPNSYTYGDTKPFIVITSGLFETIPEPLIGTVLAHECGHIACHHTLYTTMGRMLMSAAQTTLLSRVPLGGAIYAAVETAFFYWLRCSEYSADRAAILCDGGPDRMSEVCMRLAGFDKDINAPARKDEFLNQAREYRDMIGGSKWDKTLEFLLLRSMDHPLMAVRALECEEWARGDSYAAILNGTYQETWTPPSDEKSAASGPEAAPKNRFDLPGLSNLSNITKFVSPWVKKIQSEIMPGTADEPEEAPEEEPAADEAESVTAKLLREYKALRDEGVISQEDYDQLKKQLLGL